MLRVLRPSLSSAAEFSLNTGRLLALLSPLLVTVARVTDPHRGELPFFSDLITAAIIGFSIAALIASYFVERVTKHFYYYMVAMFCLHGVDSFHNLYLFRFGDEVMAGLLIFTFITTWFLRSRRDLLLYLVLLYAILVLMYFITPDRNPLAANFLIQYIVIELLLFILIGNRLGTIEKLFGQDLRYKELIERLNEGILQIDRSGKIEVVNERFCSMLGYSREELLSGVYVRSLISQDDQELLQQKEAERYQGKNDRYEIRMIRKGGGILWTQVSATPTVSEEGSVTGSTAVVVDITIRKTLEMERDRARRDMELTQQELTLKSEELEQFAGSIGKDLSEPLDGILGHVARMKRLAPGIEAHAGQHLDEIAASTRRMKDLLEALLLYATSGARHTRRRKVDLHEMMDEVRSGMASLIQQHRVSLRYETLPAVQADRIQMIRLFRSLIEHALRYRGKEMPVIHISASENFERGEYIFAVEDNGTGIDPADYDKIFRLFQKRASAEGETADLSLAISKKIVDNHGGRLWFTSSAGKGTTFFFSLPHGPLAAEEEPRTQHEAVEP